MQGGHHQGCAGTLEEGGRKNRGRQRVRVRAKFFSAVSDKRDVGTGGHLDTGSTNVAKHNRLLSFKAPHASIKENIYRFTSEMEEPSMGANIILSEKVCPKPDPRHIKISKLMLVNLALIFRSLS